MTQLIESVLGGGGEMGERMRAFDWSTTALGPLEQWPQSLRICVRIILGSGYPMAIGWGSDYTLLYNDAQRVLFGTKDATALGRRTKDVFPESWELAGPLYDRVMRQGQAYTTLADQLVTLNRNNYLEECYFALSYSPIPDDSGQVGGVFVTGIETTERVIEERRQQVIRDVASRTAEARHEDDVWRVSAETLGEHRLTIPFAFLYACRPSDHKAYLVGPSIEPQALDPPVIDYTRQNLWKFAPALASEGLVVELGQRGSVLPSTGWPVPPERAAVVPIRLRENKDAAGFLVLGIHPGRPFDETYRQFVRRIAEHVAIGLASARAYEQERQRADALAEIDRAKTAFFSNVSHEFRTPLQLLLGPLEELLPEARERLGPERHQQLLTARWNALRLLKLVNTLLDFSRLETGRVQVAYQPTDLAGLTSDIASMFRSAMDSAGLQFSIECQPIAEPIFVDREMWEKVVLNLLSNAFKFTFEGEVAISLKPVDGAVELQVRDTGAGIPDDQREKVFERFHRIERTSARTHEGTGIGLALVQELVKLHGGRVAVESAVNVGSTFTVTIPRGTGHLPAESIHTEQSVASSDIRAEAYVEEALRWLPDTSSAPLDVAMFPKQSSLRSLPEAVLEARRELIVLADDNADMREYLTRLLGDRHEVHAVADGQEALDAVRQLRPALLLADVMMPRLDGFGLLRAIRDDSVLCSTPVILVSARAGEESRVEGLRADADDYLVKPFTSAELLARVATHMKMAELRRVTAEREAWLRDLGERERESRLIVDSIPGLIATFTPAGELEFVNRPSLDYFGRTFEELQGWASGGMTHPEDLPHALECFSQSIASGDPFGFEVRARRYDDAYRWFQARGCPLRDSNGHIVRWYCLLIDIDDRKRVEEALRESERRFRLLVETIPALVWVGNPDGELGYLNERAVEYLGHTVKSLAGGRWIELVDPDHRDATLRRWLESAATGLSYDDTYRLRRADGQYRWIHSVGEPFYDGQGQIVHWYGLIIDIDDQKRAEVALGALKEQLYRENLALRDEVDRASMFEEIVGASPRLKAVLSRIAKVAPTDSTVFISGETGTGKELIARAVHKRSQRSGRAFVSVNCAALAPSLISSELFGHEKGAFTGATQRRLGRFELADGGTIFLDEVGELLSDTQAMLLRMLQEREFERVGGAQPVHVNVRVIAATNRDLKAAIATGSFRQDLYYRLNVFPVEVPPLRERKDDLLMLVEYFVQRYASRAGKPIGSIDKKTLELLQAYDWPGNIRELQNVIERSMILSSGGVFTVDELWLSTQSSQPTPPMTAPAPVQGYPQEEREIIEAALAESRGRIAGPLGAAARLNIPASTLESRIKSLKINKSQFKFGGSPRDNRNIR
jgi:PAS domain S-box-containing protein